MILANMLLMQKRLAGIQLVGSKVQAYQGAALATASVMDLTTGFTGGTRSGVQAGDLILAFYANSQSATAQTYLINSTGYTATFTGTIRANDTYDTNLTSHYKIATAGDTSISYQGSGTLTDAGVIAVFLFSGVNATTPLDVTTTTATGTNGALANPPAITPVTTGAWIVACGASGNLSANGTFASSDLSNFVTLTSDDSTDITIGAGTAQWTTGAFNPAAFTTSFATVNTYSWAAATVALRPA